MRRKALLGGFLLIFIISAAFSSVYLRPAVIGPANLPTNDITDLEPGSDSEDEDTTVPPETNPSEIDPEPTPDSSVDPAPDGNSNSTVHLAIVTSSPEEVVSLGESVGVPRTNFGFTLPGNIVNFASLSKIAADRQFDQASTVKTWHYIVSATTASLIFGAIMVVLAHFLSKNML